MSFALDAEEEAGGGVVAAGVDDSLLLRTEAKKSSFVAELRWLKRPVGPCVITYLSIA